MTTLERALLPLLLDTIEPIDPDAFEDAYSDAEIFDLLDADNDCTDPGGHVYVPDNAIGLSRCKFCGRP